MFNCAATDLDDGGEINLKKYSKYLNKKSKTHLSMAYAPDEKLPETLFVKILIEKANMLKKHLRGHK